MNRKQRILVVEDQLREQDALARVLRTEGYQTLCAKSLTEALQRFEESPDLVLSDLRLGTETALDLLKPCRLRSPSTPFVIITAFGDVQTAVAAMKQGASDYLTKPVKPDELLVLIRQLLATQPEDTSLPLTATEIPVFTPETRLLGKSKSMQEVRERLARAGQSESLVLILGESGTGKELAAAAIPESLIEAELFGYVRGAFTGAALDRIGRFEAAHTGTLFIDEIGDFPLPAQAKLLRVLEYFTINPVGSNDERKVDVRVIAATSRNLWELVSRHQFREDLFYRLNVLTIQLPPLRERKEDLPELIDTFLTDSCQKHGRTPIMLAPDLAEFCQSYDWPGNVRQLRNTIENMVVMSRSDNLSLADLPAYLSGNPAALPLAADLSSSASLVDLEKAAILSALERSRGNRTRAADALGISVRTLQRKLKAWGVAAE
jgi:DNA-binding NtrC family response regulator